MGIADFVVTNDAVLQELALRAFVGGIVVLAVILFVAHVWHRSASVRRAALLVSLAVVFVCSGILVGTAVERTTSSRYEVSDVRD